MLYMIYMGYIKLMQTDICFTKKIIIKTGFTFQRLVLLVH